MNVDEMEKSALTHVPVGSQDILDLIKEVRTLRRALSETEKAANEIRSKNEGLVFRVRELESKAAGGSDKT